MSSTSSYLGLLRIGEYHFAVPASVLQKVVPRPALTPLPDPGPLATGTFRHGGIIIPAVDLAAVFSGVPAPPQTRALVAVIRCANAILGLEIDGIRKVVNPSASDFGSLMSPTDKDEGSTLFPTHLWDSEVDQTVEVLDADALLRLPGVRAARLASAQGAGESKAAQEILHLALFHVNGRSFGVDIGYVRQALRASEITPAKLCGSILFGHHLTANQQTPIIRLPEYLGLPALGGEPEPQCGLVIETPKGTVPQSDVLKPRRTLGLLIEDVIGAIKAPLSDLHPLAQSGMGRTNVYRGVLPNHDGRHVVVLDPEALLAALGIDAATNTSEAAIETDGTADSVDSNVFFVVYRAGGGTLASALNDLEAVIPLPDFFPLGREGDPFMGVIHWRGHTVNLLDVKALTGQKGNPNEAASDVIITTEAGTYYGFLVIKVESLASATPQEAPLLSRPAFSGALGKRSAELAGNMIRVAVGGTRRNITVLDLRQLARSVAAGLALESSTEVEEMELPPVMAGV